MDLQTEYIRRHNLNIVVGTPDSYFLFESAGILYAAMISHRPRTYTNCQECSSGKLVIEIWVLMKDGMGLVSHEHLGPDEDLVSKIQNSHSMFRKIEIIRYQSEEQITTLLWKAIGGKGKVLRKELFENIRDQTYRVSNLSLVLATITYRRQPLLFDAIKDI